MNSFEAAVGAVFDPNDIKNAFSRATEEDAWLDLFGEDTPAPNIVDAKTIQI